MDIQIGDKVTYKIDNKVITTLIMNNLANIEFILDNDEHNIEILKIERPKYETIEEKKELLTEEEKEFLKQALKFGNYKNGTENGIIKYITKIGYSLCLNFSPHHCNSIYIDKNLYFKNLVEDEEYTLSELGLEE